MFYITTVVTVTQLYTFVTIHQIVHLKLAHFHVCKLHLHKVAKQGKRRILASAPASPLFPLGKPSPCFESTWGPGWASWMPGFQ